MHDQLGVPLEPWSLHCDQYRHRLPLSKSEIASFRFVTSSGIGVQLPPTCLKWVSKRFTLYLKSEDKPDCGIDCVAIEVAVSQSIVDLREHKPGVSLKFRRKSPIDGE